MLIAEAQYRVETNGDRLVLRSQKNVYNEGLFVKYEAQGRDMMAISPSRLSLTGSKRVRGKMRSYSELQFVPGGSISSSTTRKNGELLRNSATSW